MRNHLLPLLAALLAAAATAGLATADDDDRGKHGDHAASPYAIGLWGDLPYNAEQTTTGVPNLIADMNDQRLAFSVHDGDIKSGSTRCDDDVYTRAEGYFNSLRAPAMYTPGDNEWTDCDRANNGAYSSSERLAHIRSTMFDTAYSFGQRRMRLQVQEKAPYVENRRWRVGRVHYATLHVVGSDNNCSGDIAPDPVECKARDEATTEWMRETFAAAKRSKAAGVMLFMQANPGWDRSDPTRTAVRDPQTLAPEDGYASFLRALREETTAFRRPVAVVQGDSHYARIDKPLLDERGHRVENFTRVETFGDSPQNGNNEAQWIKVTVDPRSREVFSYQPQIVPANRTAVPAP